MGKSVELAKARRRKQYEAQAAKEKAIWDKVKKPLLIALIAVAVVVLGIVLFNNFYVPPNGVAVRNGSIVNVQDNWIVANLGTTSNPSCYHLANVTAPAGTTLDPDYAVTSTTLLQARYYKVDDENAAVKSVYVVGAANKTADDMITTLKSNGYFTSVGDAKTIQVDDKYVTYIMAQTNCYDSDGNQIEGMVSCNIYAYMNCAHSSSIGVCVISNDVSETAAYTEDDLLPILRETVEGIELIK